MTTFKNTFAWITGLLASGPATTMAQSGSDDHEPHCAACASAEGASETTSQAEGANVYVCPMHPEVTSDAPGTCPKCKMKLERKANVRR